MTTHSINDVQEKRLEPLQLTEENETPGSIAFLYWLRDKVVGFKAEASRAKGGS